MQQLSVKSLANFIQYETKYVPRTTQYISANESEPHLRPKKDESCNVTCDKSDRHVLNNRNPKRLSDPTNQSYIKIKGSPMRRNSSSCCNSQSGQSVLRTTQSQCSLNKQRYNEAHDWLNHHIQDWWKCVSISHYLPSWYVLVVSFETYISITHKTIV